jgi:DNA primase catalytic core
MARIPESELEQLKAQVSVVQLVEAKGIALKKHGSADLIGRCPFHNDRTPSLVVSPKKNLWHCLGACQAGGSVIDWVMRAEGVSFRHAAELLRSGKAIEALESRGGHPKLGSVPLLSCPVDANAQEPVILRQVIEFYHETLESSPEALSYLAARGLNHAEAIEKFRLGFSNRTLGLRLPKTDRVGGARLRDTLIELGIYRKEPHYEHFNGSIVIPVLSRDGQVTEIYGRKIAKGLRGGAQLHTYLPGPHRGIWNPEGVDSGEIILCEAIIDALSFWVNGFKNVTASYGIEGWTSDHLRAFEEANVRKVWIAYDRDEAGDRAAEKLSKRLLPLGIECYRVNFPKGMDANEYACKMTPAPAALQVCLDAAEPMGLAAARKTPAAQVVGDAAPIPEAPLLSLVAPIPAAPAAPLVASDVLAEERPVPATAEGIPCRVVGDDIFITQGEHEYRVRGLQKNLSFEVMRVNLRVGAAAAYYVDTLDLYQAKARTAYVNAAAEELGLKPEVVKTELGRVLFKLEELQEEQIRRALDGGTRKQEVEICDEEREQALHLLRSPDLLKRILLDFEACGVVGEETNKLVGYLAASSRKLEDPLAVIIQSSSAAGKSSLMEAVLAMMPEEEKVKYSAMTGQSLFYMGETDLKHRILAIAEEQGAQHASYALKLLQSEGEISIASTGKDTASGKMVTHKYRVEGPVMIFLTTTAIEIDEELLNRCLVLTVNEDRAQTRAIHELQRERQTLEGLLARQEKSHLLKLHQNAQRLIRPLLVVNPFARRLTFLDSRTRTRRDHIKYLTLIRAIALLHQYQREVKTIEHRGKSVEYIEVTAQDIATANELCHQILGRSLDELSPQTRRMLVVLNSLVAEACQREGGKRTDYRFTRKQVREYCGWSDFQVRMHVDKLASMEYVLAHRGGRGQSFVYELLYDGAVHTERDGPVLMGLIDPKTLADTAPTSDRDAEFEHPKGQFEGSSSMERVSIEHGSRSPGFGSESGQAAKNGQNGEKRSEGGISEPEESYPQKRRASGAGDSGGGAL